MDSDDFVETAKRFFKAYNTMDIKQLEEMISDDLHWEHHNRFKGQGKKGLTKSIRDIAEKVPGRYFAESKRSARNGETVFLEHSWHGTPAQDVPAFGWTKGVPATLDVVSVFKFSGGKIVEWGDYA